MKHLKSLLALFLICILCFTFQPIIVQADTGISTEEKAEALEILGILSGDNGNYMLDKPLLRSQAAAFVVRLLGQEDYVLLNSDDYSYTKFLDVDSEQWYAPYVGFCTTNGIIAGVDNEHYQPNNNISEQAFLKLIIIALGYEYGSDFFWTDVFKKAYEIGLVDDSSYLTKTQDNTNYLRKDVVNVLYKALSIKNKETGITILQSLLVGNAITMDQAIRSGLIKEESEPVTVEQIIALNKNSIFIKFDRKVEKIANEDIIIYETGDITKRLTVSVKAQQPDTILIDTSDQIAYEDYTVEISGVTAEGENISNTVTASFEGYRESQLESDFFRISRIVPVSRNSINVYFTHPVTMNSEKAAYYEIYEDDNIFAMGSTRALTAKYAVTPNNLVVLTLQGATFKEDHKYTLKISGGLSSVYGVKLNEGKGDSLRFLVGSISEGNQTDTGLMMTKLSLLDFKTIQLEFNMELHPTRAQQIYSYYITDQNNYPVQISKAVLAGSGSQKNKIVYLSINGSFIKNTGYTLLINEVNDISKQYSIIESSYTFIGNYPAQTVLNISSVTAADRNTIYVNFDRPVDEVAASTIQYYSITGITQTSYNTIPAKAMLDSENPNRVILYLPSDKPLAAGRVYKLTVLSPMKDSMGNIAGVNREATFNGSSSTESKPYISDAVIIASDTIKVTMSRPIALSEQNIRASNYTLEYIDSGYLQTEIPLIVGYIDNKTLVLKFDTLDFNKEYTLKFNTLNDYSGLYTRTSSDGQNSIKVRLGK